MSETSSIFDRDILTLKQQRFDDKFEDYNFLHTHTLNLISERLEDITLSFENNVYIGRSLPEKAFQTLKEKGDFETLLYSDRFKSKTSHAPFIIADDEFFPFGQGKMDLIISNLSLHQTNDLPGALIQIRKALKPDGLFIGALLGGETLWQLRQSLSHAEQQTMSGQSPRVHPFADKQQMGALMQRAGFALPVVDSEFVTVIYANIFKLMVDLRGMGETNIVSARQKTCAIPSLFHTAGKYYADNFSDQDGQLESTFEIIFLIGWAPSETQQKPLRPGSAQNRLADALGTDEISTGEKAG